MEAGKRHRNVDAGLGTLLVVDDLIMITANKRHPKKALTLLQLSRFLTPLGPHSRFGDKLLTVRVLCPHIWECGAKRAFCCGAYGNNVINSVDTRSLICVYLLLYT